MITGTEVGRLTPKLVTQIRRFLPTARQMAEQRLNQTIRAEMNFVRRRGITNESIHFFAHEKMCEESKCSQISTYSIIFCVYLEDLANVVIVKRYSPFNNGDQLEPYEYYCYFEKN